MASRTTATPSDKAMRSCLWGILFLLTALGCTDEPQQTGARSQDRSYFEAEGRVLRILPNIRLLEIRHGDVEGFMPAMAMPFEYRDLGQVHNISVGDSVHFTIAYDGLNARITKVKIISPEQR
jgi:Cu/Ag efflux protein CusF